MGGGDDDDLDEDDEAVNFFARALFSHSRPHFSDVITLKSE